MKMLQPHLFPLALVLMLSALPATVRAQNARPDYYTEGSSLFFRGQRVHQAHVHSFVDLGCGYAKDRYNVYHLGRVLPYVDPKTFRLKVSPPDGMPGYDHNHRYSDDYDDDRYYDGVYPYQSPRYLITSNTVIFRGKAVPDASASTFKDLGQGYGKDAFNVYYFGKVLDDASASSFKILSHGYSCDAFTVYYYGQEVDDASPSSFRVLDNGYAEDTFSTFYRGRKVK